MPDVVIEKPLAKTPGTCGSSACLSLLWNASGAATIIAAQNRPVPRPARRRGGLLRSAGAVVRRSDRYRAAASAFTGAIMLLLGADGLRRSTSSRWSCIAVTAGYDLAEGTSRMFANTGALVTTIIIWILPHCCGCGTRRRCTARACCAEQQRAARYACGGRCPSPARRQRPHGDARQRRRAAAGHCRELRAVRGAAAGRGCREDLEQALWGRALARGGGARDRGRAAVLLRQPALRSRCSRAARGGLHRAAVVPVGRAGLREEARRRTGAARARPGVVDDYAGVRIAANGRRFAIGPAHVEPARRARRATGEAATFAGVALPRTLTNPRVTASGRRSLAAPGKDMRSPRMSLSFVSCYSSRPDPRMPPELEFVTPEAGGGELARMRLLRRRVTLRRPSCKIASSR